MKLGVKLFGLISWVLMASGCANLSAGNLFSHYSDQNQEVYQAVVAGNYAHAKQLQSSDVGGEIMAIPKGSYFIPCERLPNQPQRSRRERPRYVFNKTEQPFLFLKQRRA